MRRAILLVLVLISVAGAQSKQTGEDPGTRVINYEVDGSVHSAFLTYRDKEGITRQKQVELPYTDQFFAPYGAFVYMSGQKRVFKKIDNSHVHPIEEIVDDGRSGKLHVMIRVGGVPFREAETEEAFGIATASGEVAR